MKLITSLIIWQLLLVLAPQNNALGQAADSLLNAKEFTTLDDALKTPDQVLRLNLSNQRFDKFPAEIIKFKNLQYLSLRNDHLKVVPAEIASLQNLRVLDLGGNDFSLLPASFRKLRNLEELYLDEDKNLNLIKDFEVLSALPKLRVLHLENDGIKKLPTNVGKLRRLESLYLGNNLLRFVPPQITGLKNLRYLDVNHNLIKPQFHLEPPTGTGVKINF